MIKMCGASIACKTKEDEGRERRSKGDGGIRASQLHPA